MNMQNEGMLKVGTMIAGGRYRIDRYLSSGGFGNTYVATNMSFGKEVVIKELFIKGMCSRESDNNTISISITDNQRTFAQQQEKFRKEARRLHELDNKHIVRVHDRFDENGTSYYVMDYIDGESLSKHIRGRKAPMAEDELMLLLPLILDALDCVHNEGIWHLDLKPANIMLDRKGNVRLIDFGASKQLRNSNGESLSTSSAMAYTPGYASPEQMDMDMSKFGPWTDLYSLGATMFNLLTNQQPPSLSEIYEDAQAFLNMPSTISQKTQKLIIWMMNPNRGKRPQSVAEVKEYLSNNRIQSGGFNTNDEDDTIIKNNGNTPKVKSTPKATKGDNKKSLTKTIICSIVALLVIVGGIVAFFTFGNTTNTPKQTTEAKGFHKGLIYVTILTKDGRYVQLDRENFQNFYDSYVKSNPGAKIEMVDKKGKITYVPLDMYYVYRDKEYRNIVHALDLRSLSKKQIIQNTKITS